MMTYIGKNKVRGNLSGVSLIIILSGSTAGASSGLCYYCYKANIC